MQYCWSQKVKYWYQVLSDDIHDKFYENYLFDVRNIYTCSWSRYCIQEVHLESYEYNLMDFWYQVIYEINFIIIAALLKSTCYLLYTQSNKNQAAWNLGTCELAVTSPTAAIMIWVVCSCAIFVHSWHFLCSIHYNHSCQIHINQRHQHIGWKWS